MIEPQIKSPAYVLAVDGMIRYGRSIGLEIGRAWEILQEVKEDKQTDDYNEQQLKKVRHVIQLYGWSIVDDDSDVNELIGVVWRKVYALHEL